MASSCLSTFPVLASLSMAAPVDDAEESAPFFIKNTFVSVFDDYLASIAIHQKRRSSSAPPAHRTPCEAGPRPRVYAQEPSSYVLQETMKCTLCSPTSPYAGSLASTSTKEDSEDDVASFMELCDDASSEDDSAPAAMGVQEPESSAGCDVLPLRLSELLPPRTVLSSNSKAWVSNGLTSLPAQVRLGFAEIAAAGQSSLMAAADIESVKTCANSDGLSLVGSVVHGSRCDSSKRALDLASEAMLAAALQSEKIYVVGYERDPFKPMDEGLGFHTQLAMVHDEALACWDLLAKGICSRGCACKWQHPAFRMTVSVSLEFVR